MAATVPFGLSELQSAWERVAWNAGCAGADGVTVEAFSGRVPSALQGLLDQIRDGRYKPMPLLKIIAERFPGAEKQRTFLVPAVGDRVLQTVAARRLSRSFEEEFLDASFAYRPGRGVHAAIARVRQWHDRGFSFVLQADIQVFFDNVQHDRLLALLAAEPAALERI